MNIIQFGLNNQHSPLLKGITFPPERRTGLLKGVGPFAQFTVLTMKDKYSGKLVEVIKNRLAMLPMNSEIATCLKEAEAPGRVQGLLKKKGDVLIMTTGRSVQKLYLPLIYVYFLWTTKPVGLKWNFGGANMIAFINQATKAFRLKFRMKSGRIATHIVQPMENGTREQPSRREQTRHPLQSAQSRKMVQSLMTKNLGNVDPCSSSRPSFSAKRKRTFTEALKTYLKSGKSLSNYATDPVQLQYAVRAIKDLLKSIDSEKFASAGFKKWLAIEGDVLMETDFIPV